MPIYAERYHDFSAGHRVVGHGGMCRFMHGHNYRVHFKCEASVLDSLGMVIDFSVIKTKLCGWLEGNWDHQFLMWREDPWLARTEHHGRTGGAILGNANIDELGICLVPFNPTAEAMAEYILRVVGPKQLKGSGVRLVEVRVEETRKCSAVAALLD